jgi:hypothetical protein
MPPSENKHSPTEAGSLFAWVFFLGVFLFGPACIVFGTLPDVGAYVFSNPRGFPALPSIIVGVLLCRISMLVAPMVFRPSKYLGPANANLGSKNGDAGAWLRASPALRGIMKAINAVLYVWDRILLFCFLGIIPFTILLAVITSIPLDEWLIVNYHEASLSGSRHRYVEGDIVLPGDSVILNLGVSSLAGAIRIYDAKVTLTGYEPCKADWRDVPIPGTILSAFEDHPSIYYRGSSPPLVENVGDIQFRVPDDERLLGRVVSVHYNASVSRAVLVQGGNISPGNIRMSSARS